MAGRFFGYALAGRKPPGHVGPLSRGPAARFRGGSEPIRPD